VTAKTNVSHERIGSDERSKRVFGSTNANRCPARTVARLDVSVALASLSIGV
jgi:hypothetical protein